MERILEIDENNLKIKETDDLITCPQSFIKAGILAQSGDCVTTCAHFRTNSGDKGTSVWCALTGGNGNIGVIK